MKTHSQKTQKRIRRHARIRAKVAGTEDRPRLSIFKSNRLITAQIINDEKGMTLASASTKNVSGKTLTEKARNAGLEIAQKAKAAKISKVVFDRGGFIYTGNVQAFAEGAREGGLIF